MQGRETQQGLMLQSSDLGQSISFPQWEKGKAGDDLREERRRFGFLKHIPCLEMERRCLFIFKRCPGLCLPDWPASCCHLPHLLADGHRNVPHSAGWPGQTLHAYDSGAVWER